jgi:peptidase E
VSDGQGGRNGDPRRILAMGGGGFTMERNGALDRFVLKLTGKEVPKICFLPTASGDPREQVTKFYERFHGWPCQPSILSLFNLGRDRIDPIEHILSQDALYIGGGSMRNMDGEEERLPVYEEAVGCGKLPPGYAADDGAALVYHGTDLSECVASRDGARVMRVEADGSGGVTEVSQHVRMLPGSGHEDDAGESFGVSELRELRAGRHRWD